GAHTPASGRPGDRSTWRTARLSAQRGRRTASIARAPAARSAGAGRVMFEVLAEPEGFEPSMQVLPAYSLSRGAPSAARSQLRGAGFYRPEHGAPTGQLAAGPWSRSNALWSARTASSMYFSSSTTLVLIS